MKLKSEEDVYEVGWDGGGDGEGKRKRVGCGVGGGRLFERGLLGGFFFRLDGWVFVSVMLGFGFGLAG